MRIRFQCSSGSGVLMTKYKNKKLQLKIFVLFFMKFSFPFGLHKERPSYSLQEKPSPLKREHPARQNVKFLNFSFCFRGPSLLSWIRIRFPNAVPDHQWDPEPNADPETQCRSGSSRPKLTRIRICNAGPKLWCPHFCNVYCANGFYFFIYLDWVCSSLTRRRGSWTCG
jgi:hypothetical protein